MNESLDEEMKKFREEIADDMGYSQKEGNTHPHRALPGFKSQRKILTLVGAGIILLIVLIAIFSGGDKKLSMEALTPIQVRLDLLEKRLTRLEGAELRIASLERQEKALEKSISAMGRSGTGLTQRLDKMAQRLDSLEKGTAPVVAKTGVSTAIKMRPLSPGKKRFHEVSPGETLYGISKKYGISVGEFCRINKITPSHIIQPGQKLLVP